MHFNPVESITAYHLKQDVVAEVLPAPIPAPVKVKPKLKEFQKPKPRSKPKPIQSFKCDGRQHCSQMKSYDEAKYFIRHCPNTKMDGDGDGIPCERQFRR